ncbi:MAG: GAF domain-containing sensor histidine kinase [Chloroflexi bacterium]|nr:GAF domain-containing sensor histidine kinase [Chloroflexota bacterium]
MKTVLSRIQEISSAVMYAAEAHDYEVVLQRIAEVSKELAATKYAALGVPDGRGGLRYFMTAGISAHDRARIAHPPEGHGLIGAIMHERQPIRVEHMHDDPRSVGFPEHHPHMDSLLGVPIIVGQQLYGMLYLCDRVDGQPFDDDDQLLIETMADYAALAIAGAALSEQQGRLRLLQERERIGMELHDGVIQSLYGIGMQVDLLRKQADTIPAKALDAVIDNLNDVIEDIRGFITNLRQRGGRQMSVRETLIDLKDRLNPPASLSIEIEAPDIPPPFAPVVFEAICLIVNEALSNAIRHAHATVIVITAEVNKQRCIIIVSDDGQGFDTALLNGHRGLGLRNMRQRARLYGGEIQINSTPGAGTRLVISIPVGSY